jgi:hypothetical protein
MAAPATITLPGRDIYLLVYPDEAVVADQPTATKICRSRQGTVSIVVA